MFYIAGVFLFWISHRLSSFYLAWGTQSYSIVRKNQPWRYFIFPAILVLSVFVLLFIPRRFSGFGSGSYSWIAAVSFFLGGCIILPRSTMGCSGSFNTGRILQLPKFNTSSRSFFCWGTGFILVLIAELPARGFFFTAEANIAGHAV
ncbi:MAG: hypothetical protein Ct9H300mP28_23490 [Pseudomonadota bacterium]|nr:MAG: hypothetical protein Ct9H300mP28_23490 [Pseudomonadota bacterium]